MLATSEAFKAAIKASVVKARAKIVLGYETPLAIFSSKIISINVQQRGEQALGCVQDDKITLELKGDSLSSEQYGQDVSVKVYIGCVVNGDDEYCCIGTFKVTKWSKTDYAISLELGTNLPDKNINDVLAKDNTSLKSYITTAIGNLIDTPVAIGDVTDGAINLAYLYYKTVKEQFKSFSFACQGILRSSENGLELVPYKFSTPAVVYKEGQGDMILDKSGNNKDLVTSKTSYGICRSMFTKEDDATLYSASNYKATDEYLPLEFSFSSPGLVQYINFKKYAYFNRLRYGLWGGTINIGNVYEGETANVDFSIVGTKISSTVIGKADDSKTYLSNPYIQTNAQVNALSLDIYNGDKYSFKSRIDPSVQVGDTIAIYGVGVMLVTSLNYKFDGGLSGNIEGVIRHD